MYNNSILYRNRVGNIHTRRTYDKTRAGRGVPGERAERVKDDKDRELVVTLLHTIILWETSHRERRERVRG